MIKFKSALLLLASFIFIALPARAQTNPITTVAGGGTQSNIAGTVADLPMISGVAVDSAGNVYLSCEYLNRVFKLTPAGQLLVVAGTGTEAFGGDGGPAASASLSFPQGLALDPSGNLLIADSNNNRIRRVDLQSQLISTVVGNGLMGPGGDGGPATNGQMSGPSGVAVDTAGNIYIADAFDNRVRRVDYATQVITTYAGTGQPGFSGEGGQAAGAQLNFPFDVKTDAQGNLYIADTYNERIRRVDAVSHNIVTVAGNGWTGYINGGDNITATQAALCWPYGIALDSADDILIADACSNRVRRVDATTQTITTVAGNGLPAATGDGAAAVNAALNADRAVAVDASGNLFIADSANGRLRKVDAGTLNISTVAGGGTGGDGGLATSAVLVVPSSLAIDSAGNLLIADMLNHRIRRVDASTQTISTIAGNGTPGFFGNGGVATLAELSSPWGIALNGADRLYIADSQNFRVRQVDLATQVITTAAGNGVASYTGDNQSATSVAIQAATGVAVDASGNLYIADLPNCRVRRVDAITQIITTVAGNGTSGFSGDGGPATAAQLSAPGSIGFDPSGNMFISDSGNNRIRRVDAQTQIISTIAGDGVSGYGLDGIPAASSEVGNPYGLWVDRSGNIFLADTSVSRVRRIDAVTKIITTVAGNGNFGFSGDGGPAANAMLATPYAVATDADGNLYIADTVNNRVRKTLLPPYVALEPGPLAFSNQVIGTSSPTQTVTLTNTGLVALDISSMTLSHNFTQTNDCGAVVDPRGTCSINVAFHPSVTGAQSGHLTVADNAFASPHDVTLSGTGVVPQAGVSTSTLAFAGHISVGTPSPPQSVTLTNGGTGVLTVASVEATGDFSQTNNCLPGVGAAASCSIAVTFTPTAPGPRAGTLTITDNNNGVAGSTQTVALTGTGTGPAVRLSTTSLTFSSQPLGATNTQPVTLTNAGDATLTLSGITATGDFSSTTSCGSTVAAGGSCTISVTFNPTEVGTRPGTLTIADNAIDSPQTVALTGTGVNFSVSAPSGTSATALASPGQTAKFNLTVGGQGGTVGTVTFTCTGAPSESTCTVSPNPVTVGTTATNITVAVATTAPSAVMPRSPGVPQNPSSPAVGRLPFSPWVLWMLALCFGAVALAYRRGEQQAHPARRLAVIPLMLGLMLTLILAGCGGGGAASGGSPARNLGTPSGDYTLTVTGTTGSGSSSVSHSVTLKLTVG